jgi:hypothetical protein
MSERQVILHCDYCKNETTVSLTIPATAMATAVSSKKDPEIAITLYCKECGRANIVTIPESWDDSSLVLGDGEVLRYSDGLPVLQGHAV